MTALYQFLACISLHVATVCLLAIRRSQQLQCGQQKSTSWPHISPSIVRCAGTIAAILAIRFPYVVAHNEPLMQAGLRCVCFFYAGKILDLAITKARTPPSLLHLENNATEDKRETEMETWQGLASYGWNLLAEMRYHGFNIAVEQKGRQGPVSRVRSIVEPLVTCLFAGAATFVLQLSELRCLCLLMFLQAGFESLHLLLHPRCSHPLFYKTLSASSMCAFWTTHWHACANSWLRSLAYRPGRRYVGRWFGVLTTFSMSGIWHGWASAALVDDQHALSLGLQVWAFFVMMSVVCLVERWIWGGRQGGLVQKVIVWGVALLAGGRCFRTLQTHSKIPWLRHDNP